MRIFLILLSLVTTLSTPLYANNETKYWYITVPFKSSDLQNAALKESTDILLGTKYSSAEASMKAELAYFEKYINRPEITNLERSYLLLMRADTHRQDNEYNKSAEKLIEIAKTGQLPMSKMSRLYYSLYEMAYGSGNFNLAAQAYSKYASLSPLVYPWDQAALAEIMIKADRNDLALVKLDAAILMLEQHECPIEPSWQKLKHDLRENNLENISAIKNASLPVLYMPLNNPDVIPESRKEPKYPRMALMKGIEGSSVVQLIINQEGKPLCVMPGDVIIGHLDFYEVAKTAAMQFKYKPFNKKGVSSWIYGVKTRFTFQMGRRH